MKRLPEGIACWADAEGMLVELTNEFKHYYERSPIRFMMTVALCDVIVFDNHPPSDERWKGGKHDFFMAIEGEEVGCILAFAEITIGSSGVSRHRLFYKNQECIFLHGLGSTIACLPEEEPSISSWISKA